MLKCPNNARVNAATPQNILVLDRPANKILQLFILLQKECHDWWCAGYCTQIRRQSGILGGVNRQYGVLLLWKLPRIKAAVVMP